MAHPSNESVRRQHQQEPVLSAEDEAAILAQLHVMEEAPAEVPAVVLKKSEPFLKAVLRIAKPEVIQRFLEKYNPGKVIDEATIARLQAYAADPNKSIDSLAIPDSILLRLQMSNAQDQLMAYAVMGGVDRHMLSEMDAKTLSTLFDRSIAPIIQIQLVALQKHAEQLVSNFSEIHEAVGISANIGNVMKALTLYEQLQTHLVNLSRNLLPPLHAAETDAQRLERASLMPNVRAYKAELGKPAEQQNKRKLTVLRSPKDVQLYLSLALIERTHRNLQVLTNAGLKALELNARQESKSASDEGPSRAPYEDNFHAYQRVLEYNIKALATFIETTKIQAFSRDAEEVALVKLIIKEAAYQYAFGPEEPSAGGEYNAPSLQEIQEKFSNVLNVYSDRDTGNLRLDFKPDLSYRLDTLVTLFNELREKYQRNYVITSRAYRALVSVMSKKPLHVRGLEAFGVELITGSLKTFNIRLVPKAVGNIYQNEIVVDVLLLAAKQYSAKKGVPAAKAIFGEYVDFTPVDAVNVSCQIKPDMECNLNALNQLCSDNLGFIGNRTLKKCFEDAQKRNAALIAFEHSRFKYTDLYLETIKASRKGSRDVLEKQYMAKLHDFVRVRSSCRKLEIQAGLNQAVISSIMAVNRANAHFQGVPHDKIKFDRALSAFQSNNFMANASSAYLAFADYAKLSRQISRFFAPAKSGLHEASKKVFISALIKARLGEHADVDLYSDAVVDILIAYAEQKAINPRHLAGIPPFLKADLLSLFGGPHVARADAVFAGETFTRSFETLLYPRPAIECKEDTPRFAP